MFNWEDFSTDPTDRGVEAKVVWKGKVLPLRIRRALSIDERQEANNAAIQIELDSNGKPVITKQDQAAYTKKVVLLGLKYWPFEYSEGKPVPINAKTVSQLDGGLLDKIASLILGTVEVDKEALDPFAQKSGAHSSLEEQQDQI